MQLTPWVYPPVRLSLCRRQVPVFSHLPQYERQSSQLANISFSKVGCDVAVH